MFVHTPTRSLLIQAPRPSVIMDAVPARVVQGDGFNVQAKHTEAATLTLRGMGLEAPSPIIAYYKWPKFKGVYDPFDHQRIMAEFATLYKRMFNLGEMGTGKTNSVLWALDYLMTQNLVHSAVIAAPLSTLERVWLIAASETIMHRRAVVVHGSREKRLKILSEPADIYIINHDGLNIKPVREALRKRKDIDLYVVDEGSKYRNARTDRYRSLEALVGPTYTGRLWWLTGTPTPKGPDNAWAQCRLVNPTRVPRYYGQFRDQTMVKIDEHKYKPKLGHERIVYAAMQPAIRFAKAECLDLPPYTMEEWSCEMTPDQKAAFAQMAGAMALVHRREGEAGRLITAANKADRINKLRQIMLGAIKVGPTDYIEYDYAGRLKVLLEGIEAATKKAVVVVPFKGAIQMLGRDLAKSHTCAIVNGDVSIGKRNRIFDDFKNRDDPHVLLCHPEVMSHGLNLTEADVLILFGAMYSNDNYRQVIERINRPPQDRKMTEIRIGCHPIEWGIYKSLDADEGQQQSILQLYNAIVEGQYEL